MTAGDLQARFQPAVDVIRKNAPKLRAALKAIDELQDAFDPLTDSEKDRGS